MPAVSKIDLSQQRCGCIPELFCQPLCTPALFKPLLFAAPVFSPWGKCAVQIESTDSRSESDGHDLGLLGCEQLVDLLHEFVGELLR